MYFLKSPLVDMYLSDHTHTHLHAFSLFTLHSFQGSLDILRLLVQTVFTNVCSSVIHNLHYSEWHLSTAVLLYLSTKEPISCKKSTPTLQPYQHEHIHAWTQTQYFVSGTTQVQEIITSTSFCLITHLALHHHHSLAY